MTDRPIIELEGLTVRYGRLTAVENLNLRVAPGSVYALLGRNGSGKSSTVRCLLGQQRATAGTARLFGLDTWSNRRRVMGDVGVVPETPNVPPEMTARRLERFLARISASWDRSKFFSRLERFGVPAGTRFSRLSKGQQKQLSLTAAISSSPQILILDDPTLGLDAVARRELFEELVGELADRGTTVLITTHDLAGVEGIADRVGILKDGHLLIDEPLEDLKERSHRLVQAPAENLQDALKAAAGGGAGVPPAHLPSLPFTGNAVSLDEIFIALCGPNGGDR